MQAQEILTATHKLEESGMTQPQAEAIAGTIVDAIGPLATKEDLRNTEKLLRSDLQSSTKELRADLRSSIKELRSDLESSIKDVRADLESSIKDVKIALESSIKDVRTDLESSIKNVRTDLESSIMELKIGQESLEKNMATKADIQSIKVWLLTGLLALAGSALLGMIGAFFFLFRFIG